MIGRWNHQTLKKPLCTYLNHQSFDVDDSNLLFRLEERLIYVSSQNKKQITLDNYLN